MLITCTNCQSKIRVPEKAFGKRVKCPKCATVLQVPAASPPEETEVETPPTSISTKPLPEPTTITPEEPSEQEADQGETEVTATPRPSTPGKKPPPMKAPSKRGSSFDDGDDDDEEEDDDRRPKKRKRRRDRDDDDMDVRRRDWGDQPHGVNTYAMTSMILGIVSLISGFGSCCCGLFAALGLLCAVLAIVFGFMGKTPGSEAYAWTGIGCGIASILIAMAAIAFTLIAVGMDGMMQFNNMNQPRRRF